VAHQPQLLIELQALHQSASQSQPARGRCGSRWRHL